MNKKIAFAGAAVALALGSVAIAQTYQEPANQPAAGAQNQPGAMQDQRGATDTTGAYATGTDAAADADASMRYAGERG